MPRVIITAEVENGAEWERLFRTRGDLFRRQSVSKPIAFAVSDLLVATQSTSVTSPESKGFDAVTSGSVVEIATLKFTSVFVSTLIEATSNVGPATTEACVMHS